MERFRIPRGWILFLSVTLLLAACGGGGGSGGSSTPPDSNPDNLTNALTRVSNSICIAPSSPSSETSFIIQQAFPALEALSGLVGLYQSPDNNNIWYAVLQEGRVVQFNNLATATTLTEFIDISNQVRNQGEMGLLGLAFSPDFAINGEFYLSYNNNNASGESTISRFTSDGSLPVNTGTEEVVLTLSQSAGNHNGGHIAFGPDGMLYIGFGDGGGANDQFGHGQNTLSWHGAILRIDVRNVATYTVPPDNPFVGDPNVLDEIYAYGLRNPWQWSFDSETGNLWLGDVGQGSYEEVDIVNAGDNLGWPIMEGNSCFQSNNCDTTGLTLPVAEYDHNNGDCSISGGYVYRGSEEPNLSAHYIYGDFCTGNIWTTVEQPNNVFVTEPLLASGLSISGFAQSNTGEVYVLNYFGSAGNGIYKIASQNSGSSDNIPSTLSATGCFVSTADKTVAAPVVPYTVISELWSDGLEKERYFAIPDNSEIDLINNEDFEFPVGSILIKHFIFNGRYLETRLLMRHSNSWGGYAYEWNDNQDDATLLPGSTTIDTGTFIHTVPSRGQCFECHTGSANVSLGLETHQLNSDYLYPSSITANQLTALDEAGFTGFDTSVLSPVSMAAIDDFNQDLETRVRSYLHSNCSGCHRPGGPGSSIDLRLSTALADTGTCDQLPSNGDLGIANARLITPGDANRSIILARMNTLDNNRMPPVGSSVVDQTAIVEVSSWINGLSGCN